MQILESSVLGLRTSRMEFESRNSSVTVTLYSMVHVGEERFYDETYAEAFAHDVVLVEGVRSSVGRNLTRSYRWLDFEKLGLVPQPKVPVQEGISARIVKADLSTEEFHREWRKVPLSLRAAFAVLAPLYGVHRRFFASRERLAHNLCLEDRRSADEVLDWDPKFEPVIRSIIDARDERLVQCLREELEASDKPEKRIAIVYGARDMRAVLRELHRQGFRCSNAIWRTIFAV